MWMCGCVCVHVPVCVNTAVSVEVRSQHLVFSSSLDFETQSLIECEAHWFHDTDQPGRLKKPPLSVSPPRGS